MKRNKDYPFTVPFTCDADLAGQPAKLLTTHPLDMVTLEFICGSKLQVHLSSIIPTMGEHFERAQAIIDSAFEYETTHQDAGDNYAHLASEGDFDYHNGDSRLQEYCAEMGIDLSGIDISRLAEDVIFWGYMTQGQPYDAKERFLVASYHVGEIEEQVESERIGARFTPYLIEQLNRRTDGYWRYDGPDIAYFYITCDSYWDHVCDAETIRDLVNQYKES